MRRVSIDFTSFACPRYQVRDGVDDDHARLEGIDSLVYRSPDAFRDRTPSGGTPRTASMPLSM